jgi:hypothetical protein
VVFCAHSRAQIQTCLSHVNEMNLLGLNITNKKTLGEFHQGFSEKKSSLADHGRSASLA